MQASVSKLLERTEQGKVSWEAGSSDRFSAVLRESPTSAFQFLLSKAGTSNLRTIYLSMYDLQGPELFTVESTELPTNEAEERLTDNLEHLYEAVRRQALKIPDKIKTVSDLLDRV